PKPPWPTGKCTHARPRSNCFPRKVTASCVFGSHSSSSCVTRSSTSCSASCARISVAVMGCNDSGALQVTTHQSLLVLLGAVVARVEPCRGETGEQLGAHSAPRRAGLVPGAPPAESTRVEQRRLLQPAGTDLDHPGEEQL